MSTPDTQNPETEVETKPAAEETSPQPAQQGPADSPTDVSHWVKAKMTTSIPAGVQAAIRELAPGKVVNISQFIACLLDDYYRLQKENQVYDENQVVLNTKLLQANDLIEELKNEYGKLKQAKKQVESTEVNAAPEETAMGKVPAPRQAEKPKAKSGDFMNLLGF